MSFASTARFCRALNPRSARSTLEKCRSSPLLSTSRVSFPRFVQPTELVQQDPFAKPQLGVAREQCPPSPEASIASSWRPNRIDAIDKESERLAQVRLAGPRPGNPAPEVIHRLHESRAVDMGHAEVEQRERVLGPLGELQLEDVQVALALLLLRRPALIRAGVDDKEIGPGDFAAGRSNGRQDLLVNPPVVSGLCTLSKMRATRWIAMGESYLHVGVPNG